jgi:hypothetical protein
MNAVAVSLVVALCVFAGAVAGLCLAYVLPEAHRSKETQDVVRLATGMLSVLASLVLGLLIATARTTFQTMDSSIRSYAAELILLDETLRDYGDAALAPRRLVRDYTERLLRRTWPPSGAAAKPSLVDGHGAGLMLEHVREEVRGLKPVDAGQKWLQDQALPEITSVMQQRWQLLEQVGPSVQPVVLGILASWIVAIFVSFGLNVPRNATVLAAFAVAALAIGSSIFLIEELDSPFAGLLRISPGPVTVALSHMLPSGQ